MHTPNVEYHPSTQSTQPVESKFGSVPAMHGEQVVRSSLMTFGAPQSWHWPNVEYVIPVQSMHCVLSSLGPLPAAQAEHVVLSWFTTFGALHCSQAIPKPE